MGKEAQNDRTATSNASTKMPTSSDETVDPTGKRKLDERSSNEQESADLRQPKDRDPVDPVQLVEAEVKAILGESITVTYLRNLCNDAVDEIGQGNERFRAFQDRFAAKFTQPCLYFDDPFKTATDEISCEELMVDIFKMQENDIQSVIQLLVGLIDPSEGEAIDDPYVWAIRELTIRVAQQDPTTFFKISEARQDPDSIAMRSFWDRSDGTEFRMRNDSVAIRFWVIASCLLGHPWRYFFHIQTPDPSNPRELDFPVGSEPVAAAAESTEKLTALEKQALAFQKYFSQKKQNAASSNVSKIFDFESDGGGKTSDDTKERSKKAKKKAGVVHFKNVVSDDMKSATATSGKKKRKDNIPDKTGQSPDRTRQKNDLGKKSDTTSNQEEKDKEDDEVLCTGVRQGKPDGDSSDEDDDVQVTGVKEGDKMIPEDGDATGDLMMTQEEAAEADETWAAQSYLEVAKSRVENGPLFESIAQKVKKLTNVDITGMPGLAYFYEMAFAMTWNGSQSGKSITKAWVKLIVDALVEAIKNSEDGLRILPFSDKDYKNQKLWLRTEQDIRSKIKTFRDLQKYIDMDYGNAQYTASNNKVGEKVFRTRMRFGFEVGVKPVDIQTYLHDGLRSLGSKAGCFPTGIQWGEQRKIGGLAFLPQEMNPRLYARELIREFGYKVPIVLVWEWANVPFDSSRMKWSDRQPGIRLWHVYVRACDAYVVDKKLREWLHPNTEKKDLPWAAPTHYFSDWKAIEADVLSVKPCGLAKDKILTLISRARDFQNLTTVLFSDSEFVGMLKKSHTANFGECSLLKLMLSIKASPDQATLADENAHESGGESMEEDEEPKNETKGFKMVSSKKKKKELEQAMESANKDLTPAQQKVEEEKTRKLLMDANNYMPSPLFLMVLPGEMEGTYILVVRVRYEQLGRNVLKGIVAFFVCHLNERSVAEALRVIKTWFSQTLIDRFRRRRQRWCSQTARAVDGLADENHDALDDGLDFLDFGADILDSFRGLLSFDLEMANAKDIDDGATVAGAMDDFLETQAQLKDAMHSIALHEVALNHAEDAIAKQKDELAQKEAENAALLERLAKMEALAAEERRRWDQRQQLSQRPHQDPPDVTAESPARQDDRTSADLVSPPHVARDQSALSAHIGESSDSPSSSSDPASRPDASSKLVSPDNETGPRGATGSTEGP